jgi:hypothetical protein
VSSQNRFICFAHGMDVNMNILANCRKHFPKDQPGEAGTDVVHPMWAEFLKDWAAIWASLMDAATEAEYACVLYNFTLIRK